MLHYTIHEGWIVQQLRIVTQMQYKASLLELLSVGFKQLDENRSLTYLVKGKHVGLQIKWCETIEWVLCWLADGASECNVGNNVALKLSVQGLATWKIGS